ncbi:MAG: two component transcriptional regulator, AraC family [Eubacterium sp.]|nr:two component transcriptional regulator, AraC family [Eubacterium sp.]
MYSILLVDDEKTIRDYLPKAIPFEKNGFMVKDTAINGAEAFEKLPSVKPDLILLDVKMPVMDGLQFLKMLRKSQYSNTLVVMLSGYSDFEYAKEAMKYGVKDYLTKPVDEDEIIPLLQSVHNELDDNIDKRSHDLVRKHINMLNSLYNGAVIGRETFKDYTLMTCVLLPGTYDSKESNPHIILQECLGTVIGDTDNYLFRSKSSHYTFLLPVKLFEPFNNSKKIFSNNLMSIFIKHNLYCSLFFDSHIFNFEENTFREDFSNHVYNMLTELFYSRVGFIDYNPENFKSSGELCFECRYMEEIRQNLLSVKRDDILNTIDKLINEIQKIHLGIHYIQEISYRIYYLILDEINTPENQHQGEAILARPEWLDYPYFISFNKWREMLISMVMDGMEFIERRCKMANMGISKEVIQFVHLHYMEQINIKKVADKFFINAAYLGRTFQKATSVNFNQYVNQLRIAEAKKLLLQTDKLIYEIANEVGFSESCYFITKFTQEVGQSPNEYRNQNISAI